MDSIKALKQVCFRVYFIHLSSVELSVLSGDKCLHGYHSEPG